MALTYRRFRNQLPDYLNGSLSPKRKLQMDRAMVKNPAWASECDRMRQWVRDLQDRPEDIHRDTRLQKLRQHARREFHQSLPKARTRNQHFWPSFALGLTLVVIFAWFWTKSPQLPATQARNTVDPFPISVVKTESKIHMVLPTDHPKITVYWTFESDTDI